MSVTRQDCIEANIAADKANDDVDVARKLAERLRKRADEIQHQFEKNDPTIKSGVDETAEILHFIDEALRDPNQEVVSSRKITMATIIGVWGEKNHKDTVEKVLRAKTGSLDERRKYELFLAYIRGFKKNNM